jgi:anti-sigma regulatory factor (Ser/Thr protein kinase)/ABC-type transporter Mla MlaB component
MRVRTTSAAEHSVLVLAGDLTEADAGPLRQRLSDLVAQVTGDTLVCDVSAVRSADPAVLAVFRSQQRLDEGPGPYVYLAGARGVLAAEIDRLEIARYVTVVPTVAAALKLARSRPPRLSVVRGLSGHPSAPRLARRFALDTCSLWDLDVVAADVELVVAELVTNAVNHVGSDLVLRLERTTDHVTVAVRDSGIEPTSPWWRPEPSDDERGGQGLTIVRALSRSVGLRTDAGGKVVWAVLAARPPLAGTRPARPVRWRVTVNAGRGLQHDARWEVGLELTWTPELPEQVALSLSSRPSHPSLPRGHWRVARGTLLASLAGPVHHGDISLWPDVSGRQLMLELPGNPPRVLRVPAARVRRFLTVIEPPAPDGHPPVQ